ncbi:MAG: HEAT repeat domain-containing protein [Cyanobacteria bacterium]|nr:HEAT repeat domain-containing protein [Cyanobacteria bacterium bin.51]
MVDADRFNNIHPGLSHEEALLLLEKPVEELSASSDRYMAAAHMLNFPGERTEQALLNLLEDEDDSQPTRLAKRKAVEVLARLGCHSGIESIGRCLFSDDHYLVENAAWALEKLGCQDPQVLNRMIQLLDDPQQNRRVLTQSLAGLGVRHALPVIRALQNDQSPGVRGAALAAVANLNGGNDRVGELVDHLFLPNQMDRQSAIQDVINAKAVELLPQVLQSPVSPVFRTRALRMLWPPAELVHQGQSLLEMIDTLMWDQPENVELVHRYDESLEPSFLFNELFGTDFSRCYLAVKALTRFPATSLWPLFEQRWIKDAWNDYGAHYFFVRLLGRVNHLENIQEKAEDICESAIDNHRPQFLKSRPAGILSLLQINRRRLTPLLAKLLSVEQESSWQCRYAALIALQTLILEEEMEESRGLSLLIKHPDPDFCVEQKRQAVWALLTDL